MINVLYTGDRNVFRGFALAVLSLIKYTPEPFCIHFMTVGASWDERCQPLSDREFGMIKNVLEELRPDCQIKYYDVTESFAKHFEYSPNKKPVYSPASMTRLLLTEVIKDVDKLIYLDCDTLAVSSLSAFEELDISDYEMAVSLDFMGHRWVKKDYFNSGVLYINMNKVRETQLFERSIELLKKKRFYFADQTALYKCSTKRLYIPWRFNEQRKIKPDTVIKHFNKGIRPFPFYVYNVKQWNVKKVHSFLKIHYFDDLYEQYDKLFGNYAPLDY